MSVDLRNFILLDKILTQHHPHFLKNKFLSTSALSNPLYTNIPFMMEEVVALKGGYNHIDGYGQDFDDASNSDLKISILSHKTRSCWQTTIKASQGTSKDFKSIKNGALRIAIVNPVIKDIDYFFIPKENWVGLLDNRNQIKASYNTKKKSYTRLEPFRVRDFTEFCTIGA